MGDRKPIPFPIGKFELIVVVQGINHPGNLGAIARTMMNYGFKDLRLVNPKCSIDDEETRIRAKHSGLVLDSCEIFDTLEESFHDVNLVVGTSGKREVGSKTSLRHFTFVWDLYDIFSKTGGKIAVVFGEEGKGLSTEDLRRCDMLTTLPTWEGYPIANLSHAVTAVLYQIHSHRVMNIQGKETGVPDIVPISPNINPNLRNTLNSAIHQFSKALPGNDERFETINNSLKRLLLASNPTENEVTRIIGAMVDATTALQHASGDEEWLNYRRRKVE